MTESLAPARPLGNALATLTSVSRLHIVVIAALGTLTFGWLFTGTWPWALSAVCALDWFVVNLLNRVVDLPEDEANAIVGTGFVARNRRGLVALGFGVLGSSLVASHLFAPAITPWRLGYHLLGLSYNWRLLPGGRRIKELYFFKNTASACGFLITVFAYPLAAVGWHPAPPDITPATIALSAAFFFLFELSYEVIYDLRDAEGDARAGVRTYAVVHGQRGAMHIVDGLILGAMSVLIGGAAWGAIPWRILVMIIAPIVQLVVYKRALHRGLSSSDCIRLTWAGALLLAAYNLWIHFELPGVAS